MAFEWREDAHAQLRESIAQQIADEAAVWEVEFNAGPGLVVSVNDAAFVAASYVLRELEKQQEKN